MNLTKRIQSKVKLIVASIETAYPTARFHMNSAPKDAESPYVVFRVEDTIDNSPTYQTIIKFMCWDDREKSSEDNTKNADIIMAHMNREQFKFEDMSIHSILTIQQNIPSEYLTDKQCIELQFDTTIYERTTYYD